MLHITAMFHLSTNLMINPASTPSTHGTTSPTYTVTSSPVDYISPNRGLIISVGVSGTVFIIAACCCLGKCALQ